MKHRSTTPSSGKRWYQRLGLTASALTVALLGAMLVVVPATSAAAADPSFLAIDKSVNGQEAVTIDPGEEFTYTISVSCSDEDCTDAVLTDALPAEFGLPGQGFEILATNTVPSGVATIAFDGCSTTVTDPCILTATYTQDLGAGAVGIVAGESVDVQVTLKAPQNLPASWPSNGVAVTNTASVFATNAMNQPEDGADVTVAIPVSVGTDVTKTWQPATQPFAPGSDSAVTLTSQNTSNVAASSLVFQDPTSATDDATALGDDNPFLVTDFAGFGAVSLPAGATMVQVDAYVFDAGSGSYVWVPGSPRGPSDIALPDGITEADVVGLRFTYAAADGAAALAPNGAAGSVVLELEQRATDRRSGDSLVGGANVVNTVNGSVNVPGEEPAFDNAAAPYAIGSVSVAVDAAKSISPSRVPAGVPATAVITGQNSSNAPLEVFTLEDRDFFTENVRFSGFLAPLAYPTGATAGTITWFSADGAPVSAPFANGDTPTAPTPAAGDHLTGFSISFTGSIPPNAQAGAQFSVTPGVGLVTDPAASVELVNTLVVSGTNPGGSADDSATAPLEVFFPDIELAITKTIQPGGAIAPGATAVVQLPTSTSTDSAFVNPHTIVVEDLYRDGVADDFWNAFQPIAIAPTQVLAGSTLTIEYTVDGSTWTTFEVVGPSDTTEVYSGNLPAGAIAGIVGLRFTFENPEGFPQGTTVSPNAVFQALPTTRYEGTPTSVVNGPASSYTDIATAQGEGSVAGGTVPVVSDVVQDDAVAQIRSESGIGTLMGAKAWRTTDFGADLDLLSSQSAERAGTRLSWGVTATGYSEVTVTDPAGDHAQPAETVFQAFDLKQIPAIIYAIDPLLRWDSVTAVELWRSGAWVEVAPPGGDWMGSNGFKGYTLSGQESAETTGVRFTVEPNDDARAASTNPVTPPVGSGVATSAFDSPREFRLVYELRNTLRVPAANPSYPWVTATQSFNDPAPGSIVNTVAVAGVQNGSDVGPRIASDTIALINQPPGVDIVKSTQKTQMVVPNLGDVPASGYPTNDFTLTAKNTSSSRASYLRVTDPMPCSNVAECASPADAWGANPYAAAAYDPATNPFERFTLTGLVFAVNTNQISPADSVVTLWDRAANGALSSRTTTVAAAGALAAADLQTVVGVSVTYQGTNPAVNGGSIVSGTEAKLTLKTQLRTTLRSDSTVAVAPFTVENYAFAQGYDPVLYPAGTPGDTPFDSDNKAITLIQGSLDVTAAKAFDPDVLLEKDRGALVTATLRATQGSSTVPTNQVTISDTDAEFFNQYRLDGLTAADVTLPTGADRVRVDVQLDGSTDWIAGTAAATASLPTLPNGKSAADVTGIRFVFDRADGGLFSNTAIPANYTATALLKVRLLEVARNGDPIVFPSSLENTVQTNSHRTDDPAVYPDANAEATDGIALEAGTFALDVSKTPFGNVHTVTPLTDNEWTLTFRNSGSGILTIADLVDTLPEKLNWDGEEPVFSTSTGGTLSTDVAVVYDAPTKKLTLSWPEDGQRMQPGETFTVKLGIVLDVGLTSGQRATNQIVVSTGQTLQACTNTSGNGQGTLAGVAANECGTTNYVGPQPGSAMISTKSVKGDVVEPLVSGAVNTTDPTLPCLADAEGYFRSPCAANTRVGGTDSWKLVPVNNGTIASTSLTVVDALPFAGDRRLATGVSRGSTFQPVLSADSVTVSAPAGASSTVEVTTAADVCLGSGSTSAWPTDPTCSTHPVASEWSAIADYDGDWADITGLRVTVDFAGAADGVLAPGGSVTVRYDTVNQPVTADEAGLAPVVVPVGAEFAWNQIGVFAQFVSGAPKSAASNYAGVTLQGGPLQVTKTITGDGAQFAPDSFDATVACTVVGADVQFDSDQLSFDEENGYTVRVDGIPLGASCSVVENGDPGSYGESSRSVTPASVSILTPAAGTDPVPTTQSVAITNDYALASLTVSKAVETVATVGSFGPFDYTVSCIAADGSPVELAEGDAEFSLEAGASRTIGGIPVLADCTVTETGVDHALDAGNSVTVSVDGAAGSTGATVSVPVGPDGATAAYTNTYAAGTLTVWKGLAGDGAGDGSGTPSPEDGYGQGPFTIAVECTYDGQTLYDDSFEIVGDESHLVEEIFPIGTLCAVSETVDGGATSTTISDASVLIVGPSDDTQPYGNVQVDVTNTFGLGEVEVVKTIEGSGAETYGAGPFTAVVTCTWVKDGETLTIPLPGGGVVELSAENGYRAVVSGLIAGAECTIVETVTGGATSTTYSPENGSGVGGTVVVPDGSPVEATVTNTFHTGSLEIVKERVGSGVSRFGDGPFTAQVTCTWEKDGVLTPIALDDDGVVVLSEENGYRAAIDDLIAGAVCVVVETDQGLATDSSVSPEDGITIVADGDEAGPATVTITNTFDVGQLQMSKTVDKKAATVGDTLVYTITLENIGEIDATDLTVTDYLPAALTVVSTDPPATAGADGELTWTVDSLPVGATRTFVITATVTSAGTVANLADVTNPPGPWGEVSHEGDTSPDGDSQAVTEVSVPVLPGVPSGPGGLASTGSGLALGLGGGAAVLLLGLALVLVRRRSAALQSE
ncbi:DUF5979 domain-containing protein [Herbiconiux sp. CPCC 203407]|uniref:DUF5979 domain-containing protein n=1 Tax=Herbiconiux oxytropis TaxID=2970915 RepID=A0AA41XHU4_9MICO|nr:DUF5979 domain-containing protein [Herbiconiux oxytropis]MCS5723817.1 DUF5979 domain-containing protein [Herbiconiux oxytropis]MCS5726599.1 DUF5979 domain-containing protein [Herbiconiux oxytropis]